MEAKLIIGKIPYANLFPLYYYLERKCDSSNYKFIKGVPSTLNKMLRKGKIDVSPSSSIEYLKHKDKYSIIPWLSISSSGHVGSIFLFSNLPLEALNKKTIGVSSHSDTSVVLLKIILKDFLSLNCKLSKVNSGSLKKILSSFPACLLIGDQAMREAKKTVRRKALSVKRKTNNSALNSSLITHRSSLYIYDLGELWFKHTGLPFVFALWIVRKKTLKEKEQLVKKLSLDLINAKEYASKKLSLIAKEAPQKKWLSEKGLVNYWKGISYDFTDKHLEGLRLFEKYALKSKFKS
jgi:chorismate dehydratase